MVFREQSGRPLEIEDKVNWNCLLINGNVTMILREILLISSTCH